MNEFLQGKSLRHPLHPLLVHFPIALFVMALILDVASWIAPDRTLTQGAFYAIGLGVVTALLAAVPGMIDYNGIRQDHPAKRIGFYHMLLNFTVVALYILNLGLRYPDLNAPSTPPLPFWLSVGAIVLLSVSGYLGGAMVYDDGIGVGRHRRKGATPERTLTASPTGPADELIHVANENAIADGETLRVDVQGQAVCVAKSEGRFYAFQEFCTHRYGPLSEGALCQNEMECPWHRSVFDVRTGKVLKGPAKVNLKIFRVEVRQGEVYVSPRPDDTHQSEQHDIAA